MTLSAKKQLKIINKYAHIIRYTGHEIHQSAFYHSCGTINFKLKIIYLNINKILEESVKFNIDASKIFEFVLVHELSHALSWVVINQNITHWLRGRKLIELEEIAWNISEELLELDEDFIKFRDRCLDTYYMHYKANDQNYITIDRYVNRCVDLINNCIQ